MMQASKCACDSSSLAHSSEGGDETSAFCAHRAGDSPTVAETVQEGDLDKGNQWPGGQWPAGEGLAEGHVDGVQVDSDARTLHVSNRTGAACGSGLQVLASDANESLVVDTNDPG